MTGLKQNGLEVCPEARDVGDRGVQASPVSLGKGTEGTRTTAAGATKGLADLSLQMRGLGEGGEKGLRSTLGLLIADGECAGLLVHGRKHGHDLLAGLDERNPEADPKRAADLA